MISQSKWQALKRWMQALEIDEADLIEKFIIGSGSGGQKLQKTASCVDLMHKTSQIRIKCQQSRHREDNRYYARRLLCERVDACKHAEKSKKRQRIEKIKRQKRKRSKRAKEKILADKGKISRLKQLRKKPSIE